jgi:hypothetical protein
VIAAPRRAPHLSPSDPPLSRRGLRCASARSLAPLVALVAFAAPFTAGAHQIGLSQGLYRVDGAVIHATFTFARGELRALAPELDGDDDATLSELELMSGEALLRERLVEAIAMRLRADVCAPRLERAALVEEDGLEIQASYRCPAPGSALEIDFAPLIRLGGGHRHIARVALAGEGVRAERVLHRMRSRLSLDLDALRSPPSAHEPREAPEQPAAEPAPKPRPDPGPEPAPDRERWPYFALGVEHILSGLDHLVFLLGLLLVAASLRAHVAVITAFTVGHSLSLGAAALGVWSPTAAVIEPLIGLTIAYVGLENLLGAGARGRWRVALPFGLIHGFGFASALALVGLPARDQLGALALFNLGVEAGQLLALALITPSLALLGRTRLLRARPWRRWLSAAIALAGLVWLVARL